MRVWIGSVRWLAEFPLEVAGWQVDLGSPLEESSLWRMHELSGASFFAGGMNPAVHLGATAGRLLKSLVKLAGGPGKK